MNNNERLERLELILKVLNEAPQRISASDIHKSLINDHHLDVSLETIEEDILEIVRKGFLALDSKNPMTVSQSRDMSCVILLTNEEITYLLVLLPDGNPFRERLISNFGLDGEIFR
jgi:hypothetical protein